MSGTPTPGVAVCRVRVRADGVSDRGKGEFVDAGKGSDGHSACIPFLPRSSLCLFASFTEPPR